MAQAFTTCYELDYKWNEMPPRRKPFKPAEEYFEHPPKGTMWKEQAESDHQAMSKYDNDQLKAMIQQLYRNRLVTTYQIVYNKKQMEWGNRPDLDQQHAAVGNELLEHGKRLFSPKKKKVMKPLATSRKLYGYMRPSRMYTALTDYEDGICRLGYELLKNDIGKDKNKYDMNCI